MILLYISLNKLLNNNMHYILIANIKINVDLLYESRDIQLTTKTENQSNKSFYSVLYKIHNIYTCTFVDFTVLILKITSNY